MAGFACPHLWAACSSLSYWIQRSERAHIAHMRTSGGISWRHTLGMSSSSCSLRWRMNLEQSHFLRRLQGGLLAHSLEYPTSCATSVGGGVPTARHGWAAVTSPPKSGDVVWLAYEARLQQSGRNNHRGRRKQHKGRGRVGASDAINRLIHRLSVN